MFYLALEKHPDWGALRFESLGFCRPQRCCSQDCYVHNVRFTYKYCIHPTIVNLAYKIRMFATFGRTVFKVYLNRGEHSVTALFIEHVREIFANIRPSVCLFLRSVLQHL